MKFFNKKLQFIITNLLLIILISCENSGVMQEPYIDPHIIFTSRRWWNYDIFITDVYGTRMTHLTKNKWLDFNPTVSSNGKKLAFVSERDGNREIYTVDLVWLDGFTQWEGRNLTNITLSEENDWTPRFSPINNNIVFATYFPFNDNYDIFIMNSDGTNKKNITNSKGYEKYPQFSPDGSFIIYQAWQKGKQEIYFSNLLDNNNINLTNNPKANDIISKGNSISPDVQKIVFTSDRDGNKNIYIMNTDGSQQTQLTNHEADDYEPIISPDGLSIVFTSERDGNREIYIMNKKGNNKINISNNLHDDWNPRYFTNSQKIAFQSIRDGNWEIYMMKINGSNQTNLTNDASTDYSFVILPIINQ